MRDNVGQLCYVRKTCLERKPTEGSKMERRRKREGLSPWIPSCLEQGFTPLVFLVPQASKCTLLLKIEFLSLAAKDALIQRQ